MYVEYNVILYTAFSQIMLIKKNYAYFIQQRDNQKKKNPEHNIQ